MQEKLRQNPPEVRVFDLPNPTGETWEHESPQMDAVEQESYWFHSCLCMYVCMSLYLYVTL